jgi:hypothetical protein
MRALPIVFSMFLAASAYAQGSAVVYTPRARDLSVPTYVNATVVRVDASRHIVTFRSESGDVALATGHSALRSVGALRRGDQVLLGFDRSVRPYRVVSAFQGGEQPVGQGTSGGGAVSVLGSPSLAAVAATSPLVLSSMAPCDVPGVVSAPVAGISAAVADTGVVTLMEPASPYARVIPSLPPVTTEVSLVTPTGSMPATANGLLGSSSAAATRDLDAAMRTLALKANEIDRQWSRYRDVCVTRTSVNPSTQLNVTDNRDRGWFALFSNDLPQPDADDCRQQNAELSRMASDWRDTMTRVEDAARQSGLPPGTMREIRARYRVDF